MLFTQDTLEVSDLATYEENIDTEGLDLNAKILRAKELISESLTKALKGEGCFFYTCKNYKPATIGPIDIEQVVTTPPLKLWFTFSALAIAYRDAYNKAMEEKHAVKWKEYHELAGWASKLLLQTGVGITTKPDHQTEYPEFFMTVPVGGLRQ